VSRDDYTMSRELVSKGYSFRALVMAALQHQENKENWKLRLTFENVWNELVERHCGNESDEK